MSPLAEELNMVKSIKASMVRVITAKMRREDPLSCTGSCNECHNAAVVLLSVGGFNILLCGVCADNLLFDARAAQPEAGTFVPRYTYNRRGDRVQVSTPKDKK
jgi:hypothetical protein